MDLNSLLHAHNKIMADRATSNTTVRSSSSSNMASNQQDAPPPAYSTLTAPNPHLPAIMPDLASTLFTYHHDDDDDDTSSIASSSSTDHHGDDHQTLTINAATTIHGSSNTITIPPVDGPRLTAILLSLLHGNLPTQQQQQQQQQQQNMHLPRMPQQQHHLPGQLPGTRPLSVRIDCGVRIVGDGNVLGPAQQRTAEVSSRTPAVITTNGGVMACSGSGQSGRIVVPGGPMTPPETPPGAGEDENGGVGATRKRKAEGGVERQGGCVKREKVERC